MPARWLFETTRPWLGADDRAAYGGWAEEDRAKVRAEAAALGWRG
jgi:hypothetical protein